MFGRDHHEHDGPPPEQEIDVAVSLEQAVGVVEDSVSQYLTAQTPLDLQHLLQALDRLDEIIDRSDAYESSIVDSAVWGMAVKGSSVGETGASSAAEEIPSDEFSAQIALVKAAKDVVRHPTAGAISSLKSAQSDLASVRHSQ